MKMRKFDKGEETMINLKAFSVLRSPLIVQLQLIEDSF